MLKILILQTSIFERYKPYLKIFYNGFLQCFYNKVTSMQRKVKCNFDCTKNLIFFKIKTYIFFIYNVFRNYIRKKFFIIIDI